MLFAEYSIFFRQLSQYQKKTGLLAGFFLFDQAEPTPV